MLVSQISSLSHRLVRSCILLACFSTACSAGGRGHSKTPVVSHPFSIEADDGYVVQGQIDCIRCTPSAPVVLIVPGSGGHDRRMRQRGADPAQPGYSDHLAARLLLRGYRVARFDERGFSCPRLSDLEFTFCVDQEVVKRTSRRSRAADLRAVVRAVTRATNVPEPDLVFLGISEGLVRIADLTEFGMGSPRRVVSIGGPLAPPAEVAEWQMVDRAVIAIRQQNAGNAASSLRPLVLKYQPDPDVLARVLPIAPSGRMDEQRLARLRSSLLAVYRRRLDAANARPEAGLQFYRGDIVVPNRWLVEFSQDRKSVPDKMSGALPCIVALYGAKDYQLDLDAQEREAVQTFWSGRLIIRVLPNLGHVLESEFSNPALRERAYQAVDEALKQAVHCAIKLAR